MIHYRQHRNSDYLGSVEIEIIEAQGNKALLQILKVEYKEKLMVNGKMKDRALVLTFQGQQKPWICNPTNATTIYRLTGQMDATKWVGTTIELYVDPTVKMKGEVVGGVRVRPLLPKANVKPEFTADLFERAKNAGATLETIEKSYTISETIKQQYLDYVTT